MNTFDSGEFDPASLAMQDMEKVTAQLTSDPAMFANLSEGFMKRLSGC